MAIFDLVGSGGPQPTAPFDPTWEISQSASPKRPFDLSWGQDSTKKEEPTMFLSSDVSACLALRPCWGTAAVRLVLIGVVYVVVVALIGMGHSPTAALQIAGIGGTVGIGLGALLNQRLLTGWSLGL